MFAGPTCKRRILQVNYFVLLKPNFIFCVQTSFPVKCFSTRTWKEFTFVKKVLNFLEFVKPFFSYPFYRQHESRKFHLRHKNLQNQCILIVCNRITWDFEVKGICTPETSYLFYETALLEQKYVTLNGTYFT